MTTTTGVYGPIASSLDDLALAYRSMASPDPTNPISAAFPHPLSTIPSSSTTTSPKTIGIVPAWIDRADPAVRTLFIKALDHYSTQHNYEFVELTIPYLPEGQKAHALTILSEIATSIASPRQSAQLTAPNKVLLSVGGSQATAQDFLAAQRLRNLLMSHLSHLFHKHGRGLVIATPTTPMPGWKIAGGNADLTHGVSDGNSSIRCMEYAWLANFTGCPAISCPMGYLEDTQIPVGIMGMGEWGSEEALLEWGRDGEGILDVDTADTNGDVDAAVFVGKGLKTPGAPSSNAGSVGGWVDVISKAQKLSSS
jgi:Asp-tRNA(Asn)/Glu-tRNA(Gln) amidotransferase A subunit family amidase